MKRALMTRFSACLRAGALVLLAGCAQVPGETRGEAPETPDELARLVPQGAVAFVRLSSLDACETMVRDALRPFEPREAERFTIVEALREAGVPGDFRLVDRARPVGIALSLHARTKVPLVTVIAPTTDRAAFLASVSRLATAVDGEYVGASLLEDYAGGIEPSPLARALPGDTLALRCDLQMVIRTYRSTINMGLTGFSAMMTMSAMSGDAQAAQLGEMLALYMDGLRALLDAAERLDLGLSVKGADLELDLSFLARAGSAMGEIGSAEPTGIRELSATLAGDERMAVLLGMDMGDLAQRFEPLVQRLAPLYPDVVGEMMEELSGSWQTLYGAMGSALVLGGDMDGGMRFAQYLQPSDPETVFNGMREMYAGPAFTSGNLVLEPPRESTLAGARVLSLRLDLLELAVDAAEAYAFAPPGAAGPDMRALMGMLYGTEGTSIRIASKGERMVVLTGGDEAWAQAAIERMHGGGQPSPRLEAALRRVEKLNPCLAAEIDIGDFVARSLGVADPELARRLEAQGPLPATSLSLSLGVAGRTWKGHVSADLAGFAALGRAVERSSR